MTQEINVQDGQKWVGTPNETVEKSQTENKAEETVSAEDYLNVNLPLEVRKAIKAKQAELKEKLHLRKVFVIIVEGDVEAGEKPYYIAYLRRPNLMQFSQYMNFVQKDIVQANQILAQNTFLDGDKELVDDEDLFLYGTMPQVNHIIDSRNADIVKK